MSFEYNINSGRQEWIDILKGLAILLVVVGHMPYTESTIPIKHFIYSFHMPLFFSLAGCTAAISYNKSKSVSDFFKRRCISVFLPYIIWCFLYDRLFPTSRTQFLNYDFNEHFHSFLSGGATWFLITLFLLQLYYIFYIILSSPFKSRILQIVISCCLFLLSFGAHRLIGQTSYEMTNPIYFITTAYVYFIPFSLGVIIATYPSVFKFILSSKWFITICVCIFLVLPTMKADIPFGGNYTKIIIGVATTCVLIKLLFDFTKKNPLKKSGFVGSCIFSYLSVFGKYSLGIYLLSSLFLPNTALAGYSISLTSILYILFSTIICMACVTLEKIVCTSPIMALLLFGKKIK